MKNVSYRNRLAGRLAALIVLMLGVGGCGGGSASSPASGGGSGSGGGPFQARPFPGDYFTRLPNQDGGTWIPYETYDPALKELFVSNPDLNTVEVYSTVDGHWVGEISVPGPAGLSFFPGDTELVIGTITPYVYIADPASLHVINQISIPTSVTTNQPVMPYAMADGSIFLGVGSQSGSSYTFTSVLHLVRYDPVSGSFTLQDPGSGGVTTNPVLSLDGKHLLVGGLGNSTLELFLYSTDAQGYAVAASPLPNTGYDLAINADGSQFAAVQQNPSPGAVTFLGSNLQVENQYSETEPFAAGAVFSRDGKYLYVLTENGILLAFNAQTGKPAGYIGLAVGSLIPSSPLFFDVDESYHLFGAVQPGGVMVLNASQPQASPPAAMPLFTLPSTEANPNVGPITGGTQVQFIPAPADSGGSADGIDSSMEAYFGATPATQDVVAPYPSSSNGGNFLTATAPPGGAPGPTTVVLTDANGDTVFLPDAYTYGPHLLRVEPNTASAKGGDTITIFAYGLGFFDADNVRVTIGGTLAGLSSLNSYGSSDYPEQSVTVTVPPGTPGWADITLTTVYGSDTLKRGFQYLTQEANLTGGPFTFAVYDAVRDLFYLTGDGNSVAVFNPETQVFLQPLQSPAVSSGAVLEGVALTPDNSKLLVSDPSDQSVIVFDLVAGTSTSVKVILPSDPAITLSGPMSIATAAGNRAFVSLTPCIPAPVREINLTDLSVQTRPDATSTCPASPTYPELGASSADGSTIIFSGNTGEEAPEYVWRYDAPSDSFTGPVLIVDARWVGGQVATDSDGGLIALSQGTLDQRLLPLVPLPQGGLDSRLHETGSLLYAAETGDLLYAASSSILVSDTHNGGLLLMIGLPSSIGPYRPLAIDPSGEKILVAEQQGGVSYFELSVVPLAVGTVSPAQVSSGGSITIRGSGFLSGTTTKIGSQTAACTETDSETLSCTVPSLPSGPVSMTLTNPDGQTYAFENAFVVQ
jgi:hypothetical protein